ncbi:unnamed protein product [Mortierella alpina]
MWILVLSALLSLTVLVTGQTTALPENDPSPPSWSSDTIGTTPPPYRSPFVKTFGLRHKPSMDWGMRARARNQVHWDKYWSELETGQEFDVLSNVDLDLDLEPDLPAYISNVTLSPNTTTTTADGNSHLQLGADAVMQPESSGEQQPGTAGTTPGLPPGDADPGYFFTQLLDHYADPSPGGASAEEAEAGASAAAKNSTTFRQRYRINDQFYKPGGPLILWLPGESPLHSLFLGRGLSYELANATAGLLVALEHRFYGSSIPRFQDAPKPRPNTTSNDPVNNGQPKDDFNGMNARPRGTKGRGVGGGAGVWGTTSATQSNVENTAENTTHGARSSSPTCLNGAGDGEGTEGLPLDLLKYLTVDQSIEDIVSFMDDFPATHPTFFDDTMDDPPRWILTGCSYGGNLAAWTRQRHPSKVFAAFASSAPLRSTLDFFEYSTSQTDVFGKTCASQLAHARDFLDDALLMTDAFMHQMDILDSRKAKDSKGESDATSDEHDPISATFTTTTTTGPPRQWTQEARRAAKLRVLSWFSPDFANEYAVDGEEVHAAGWIWWTVASAVQYNAVVVPPTVKPTKTVVDVLCDTMALGYKDIILQNVDQETTGQSQAAASQEAFTAGQTSFPQEGDPLHAVRFARTLAMWFRNQQFFTPTRNEDLQPSDMDPHSVQNLAGMAWLWQTCSELGYLQTSHPSTCCCGAKSVSFSTDDSTTDTTNDNANDDDNISTTNDDMIISSTMANASCSLPKSPLVLPAVSSSPGSFNTSSPFHFECASRSKPSNSSFFVPPLHHDASSRLPDSLDTTSTPPQPSSLQEMTSGGPQDCSSGENRSGRVNDDDEDDANAQKNATHVLLPSRYPNVESNVNKKFHGWRIAQESYSEHSGANDDDPTDTDLNDSYLQRSSSASIDITTASTVVSSRTRSYWSSTESLFFRDVASLQRKARRPRASGGSRYYFTNGEYDPWRELTLASPKALRLLGRTPRHRNKSKERSCQRRRGRNDSAFGQDPNIALASSTTTTATVADVIVRASFSWSSRTELRHRVKRRARNRRRHRRHQQLNRVGTKYPVNSNGNRIDAWSKFSSNEAQGSPADNEGESLATEALPLSGAVQDIHSRNASDDEQSPGRLYEAAWWHHQSDKNELRIISGASHCQDILYESSDLDSKELRAERLHVLATFVRWIEIDIRRQQRMRRHRRPRRRRGSFSFRT